MLARNFKSATELGIPEKAYEALIKVLVLFETDKLKYTKVQEAVLDAVPPSWARFSGLFNMSQWFAHTECGTVACIGGTAQLIEPDIDFVKLSYANDGLHNLFYPAGWEYDDEDAWDKISVEHATIALRNYLTIGKANWHQVSATDPN